MGSWASRRRRNRTRTMSSQNGDDDDEGQNYQSDNIASILAYLIRSGQVRILNSSGSSEERVYDEDEEENDYYSKPCCPEETKCPNTRRLDQSDFRQEMLSRSYYNNHCLCPSLPRLLSKRELGHRKTQNFTNRDLVNTQCRFLPNTPRQMVSYHAKAFCGTYSADGNVFLSACQDQNIRVYDTQHHRFKLMKTIRAKDVGWSVLDTAFSPDGNYLIYSSWSEYIHICNVHGEHRVHDALYMRPENQHSFAIFSIKFSSDNTEILGGANDGNLYIFNRELNERTLHIDAHEDDVNAVAFADDTSQILFSGGDDGLVKVWDRRALSDTSPSPVGVFAGHTDGTTFIDSKGDARYLLSNSKDQTIKLWDMRAFSSGAAQNATRRAVANQRWDYRWQQVPKKLRMSKQKVLEGDTSLMTYRGHCVLHTLIRARFSPAEVTGQRYIYSGCATGAVIVYDVLTGRIVSRLNAHKACVRDVSWHPRDQHILSTSWDGTVCRWDHLPDVIKDEFEKSEPPQTKKRSYTYMDD